MDPSCDPDTAYQAQPSILLPNDCTSYYILYLYKDDLAHKETFTRQKQQLPIVRRRPIYHHSRRPDQSATNTKPRLMVKRGRKQEKHQQKEPSMKHYFKISYDGKSIEKSVYKKWSNTMLSIT